MDFGHLIKSCSLKHILTQKHIFYVSLEYLNISKIVITKIFIKDAKYNISRNILELIDLLWSIILKSKQKQKNLKCQENSKKQL